MTLKYSKVVKALTAHTVVFCNLIFTSLINFQFSIDVIVTSSLSLFLGKSMRK